MAHVISTPHAVLTPPPIVPIHIHVTSASQLLPLVWIAGGVTVGIIVYLAILTPLRRLGEQHHWVAFTSVVSILGTVIVLWGALGGLYLSLDRIRLPQRTSIFLDRAIAALFVLSLTWIAARFAGAWINAFSERTEHRLFSVSLYSSLVQGIILLLGVLMMLNSLGIAIAPLLTTLGLGGLAVALALNDTLANLFSGVHIVAARQIRPGDYVKFDFGVEGNVTDIKWHNTTIRDPQNNLVVVPNAKVNTSVYTNYSMCVSDLMVPVTVPVAWKGSYGDLERLACEAAKESVSQIAGRVEAEKCEIFLSSLSDATLQITANLPAGHTENRTRVASEFLRRLYDALHRANMGQTVTAAAGRNGA
jgi:small-conductance mechanosensitive channel